MRALALDIGEVRIGVAATDASGTIASPVKVLPAQEVLSMSRTFRMILEDYEPEVLVCGRPKTLSGEDGPQAEKIMAQARQIASIQISISAISVSFTSCNRCPEASRHRRIDRVIETLKSSFVCECRSADMYMHTST